MLSVMSESLTSDRLLDRRQLELVKFPCTSNSECTVWREGKLVSKMMMLPAAYHGERGKLGQ